jgi:uncharacterized protein
MGSTPEVALGAVRLSLGHGTTAADIDSAVRVLKRGYGGCSIGNAPSAAVLWAGSISFGGVVSFIFADLLIIPIPGHLPPLLRS